MNSQSLIFGVLAVWFINHIKGDDNEIITGEHFDDVVSVTDGRYMAYKNTLLVIYTPDCEPRIDLDEFPSIAYMYVFTHDRDVLNYVWYDLLPTDDLKERYASHIDDCQIGVFIRKGQSMTDHMEIWTRSLQQSIRNWAWDRIWVSITIKNTLATDITVSFKGKNTWPKLMDEDIERGSTKTIQSYPGYYLDIKYKGMDLTILSSYTTDEDNTITIENFGSIPDVKPLVEKEAEAETWAKYFVYTNYDRIMLNNVQPLIVRNFTDVGYKMIRMPDELFSLVSNFFRESYDNQVYEEIGHKEQMVLNKHIVPPLMVYLTDEVTNAMSKYIQPILEEWCQCKLQFKIGYGIREYHKGSILVKHVDKIQTHVISALIQVDQELLGDDWLLQVIGFDGKRKEMKMQAGDMLLYESAKLIHGRPKTFQGSRYANCFFHYSPVSGWNFDLYDEQLINNDNGQREFLRTLKPEVKRRMYLTRKEEL